MHHPKARITTTHRNPLKSLLGIETGGGGRSPSAQQDRNPLKSLLGIETQKLQESRLQAYRNPLKSLLGIETHTQILAVILLVIAIH